MFIIKNAIRSIGRTKGRNILIGIIVFIIALSACIGLSIRQAGISAKEETLKNLTVSANISFDRRNMMSQMRGEEGNGGQIDRDEFAEKMNESSSLTIEEYQKYAKLPTVKDFTYSLTVSFAEDEDFKAVTSNFQEGEETETQSNGMGGFGGMPGMDKGPGLMQNSGDFSVIGYSGRNAMESFVSGTSSVTDGEIFAFDTEDKVCLISSELADYNAIDVGDKFKLINPNDEDEVYKFKVVGIYTDSSANESSFSPMGMTASDPANQIYMPYTALNKILEKSKENSEEVTDETTGRVTETALKGDISGNYTFNTVEDYEQFEADVREAGLDEAYTVSSNDISAYEDSLLPLENLSKMSGYFLIVVLAIGAVILVVINIFNVRERKYEIGVLTAMGMKKGKVALQFLTEIFVVTLAAVIIGAGIGAVSSVPVTNSLLESQVVSMNSEKEQADANFGRGEPPANTPGGAVPSDMPNSQGGGFMNRFLGTDSETAYVTEISSAMNITVVLQMLGIGIALTFIAGAVSMLFVMRYEPLKILANRD